MRGRDGRDARRTSSGTNACSMGLLIALRALDVGPGDEVITTPMTFAATANAILHLGATPRFVDVEPTTGLIDPAAVRAAVGPKTVGILPGAPLRAAGRHEGAARDRRPARPLRGRGLGARRRDGARRRAPRRPVGGRGLLVLRDEEPHVRRRRRRRDARRADRRAAPAAAQPRRQQGGDRAPRQRLPALGPRRARVQGEPDRSRRGAPASAARRTSTRSAPSARRVALRYEATCASASPTCGRAARGAPRAVARRAARAEQPSPLHDPRAARRARRAALEARGRGHRHGGELPRHPPADVPRRVLWRSRAASLPVAEEIGDRTISLPMYPTLGREEQDRVVEAVAGAW